MLVSEHIANCQKFLEEFGDVEVVIWEKDDWDDAYQYSYLRDPVEKVVVYLTRDGFEEFDPDYHNKKELEDFKKKNIKVFCSIN